MPPTDTADASLRPDYGLDAPGVVRNLFLVAALGLGGWALARLEVWSGRVPLAIGSVSIVFNLKWMGFSVGLLCAVLGGAMVWSSRVGKLRARERLLDLVSWSGSERVLDVGCGRGLLLVAAARRVPRGQAVGVDLWQAQDLSGNRPEAALENARREGVAERVRVETGDMRKLPFADATFDVIVSRYAIHNIYQKSGRAQALAELLRVLAPGGQLILHDIAHLGEYERALRGHGLSDLRRAGSVALAWLLSAATLGAMHPGILIARKRA